MAALKIELGMNPLNAPEMEKDLHVLDDMLSKIDVIGMEKKVDLVLVIVIYIDLP